MLHTKPIFALLTALFVSFHTTAADPSPAAAGRHPLITSSPGHARRQTQCSDPRNTICPDGFGCCPDGTPCALNPLSIPICAAQCDRPLVLCLFTSPNPLLSAFSASASQPNLCCNRGSSCDTQSTGLCTPTAAGTFDAGATFTGDLSAVGYETTASAVSTEGESGSVGGTTTVGAGGSAAATTTSTGGAGSLGMRGWGGGVMAVTVRGVVKLLAF